MKYFVCIVILCSLVSACNQQSENNKTITQGELKEPLIRANKTIADRESDRIDNYIERRGWQVKESGTGLRYFIYKHGEGDTAKAGQYATVNYTISLLNGTVCYTSEGKEPKRFLIDRDNVESGMHEGVKYMRVGDRAKFILPSHLGHGLTGDLNKIPLRSVLIFDIELIALD